MRKEYHYTDPVNDDFAPNNIEQKPLPVDYEYISHSFLRRCWDFFIYHFVAVPIVWVYQKVVYGERIVGKKAVRAYLKKGFFLYGNHTRSAGDAFTPTLITFPRKANIIINPDGVSIPFVRHLVKSLGGFPIPNKLDGMRNFHSSLMKLAEDNCVTIYPEAHIWPMYTGIRPFKSVSFKYPAEAGKPVFTFTVTYRKRFLRKIPGTTVYIDGPFFPDSSLSLHENREMLRNKAYEAMCERSKKSTYEYNTYICDSKPAAESPQTAV